MPDTKTSQLAPARTPLDNADAIAVTQDVGSVLTSRKLTLSTFATWAAGALGISDLDDRIAALEAGGGSGVTDPTLIALGNVSVSADQLIYATGTDAFTTTSLTATGRSVIGAASLPALKTFLALTTADVSGAAPLASPTFTGVPAAPTASIGTNTTQLATTAFVQAALAALVASSPSALDTLNELAAALGNDANFATTMTNALAAKAPLASPAFTGVPTAPTAALGTNTTQIATMAALKAAVDAAKVEVAPPIVVSSGTLAMTAASHQGRSIVLDPGAVGISFDAAAEGNGFTFTIYNQTGADWTVPAITNATRRYSRLASHSVLLSGGVATFEVVTSNGTRYVMIAGDTA